MSEYQDVMLARILYDNDVWHRAGLVPQHFTSPKARAAYQAISALLERGEPANLVTVAKEHPEIDRVWLAELTSMESGGPAEYYVSKVKQEAKHHWLWRLTGEAKEQLEAGESTDGVLEFIEDGLTKITMAGREDDIRHVSQGLPEFIDELERREKLARAGEIPGVPTGFDRFDGMLGGFEKGKLYYVGARPSQGKSALLLNFVAAAAKAGRRVGIISLESSEREIYARFFSANFGVPNNHLRSGLLVGKDKANIALAVDAVKDWPVWICDNPDLDLANLKTVARKLAVVHKVDILYIDYLQYVQESRPGVDRKDHVAEVSRGFKGLARRLDLPVVAAAQLRREADGRAPTIGDFAESSGLEKDADAALLLHHREDAGQTHSWIIAAKVRDGETGWVPVSFVKEHVRFTEVIDGSDEPW